MAWNDDENAPQPGVSLCRIEDVPESQGREFVFGGGGFPFCMFMVRKGETIKGYVNACPHTGAPLNWSPTNSPLKTVGSSSAALTVFYLKWERVLQFRILRRGLSGVGSAGGPWRLGFGRKRSDVEEK